MNLYSVLPTKDELARIKRMAASVREALAMQMWRQMRDANCNGLGSWWLEAEDKHRSAKSPARAAEAAAPAIEVCWNGCPVVRQCAVRAAADHYSGLAAGQAWRNGTPRASNLLTRGRPRHELSEAV